jgi:hypothetical protein
MMVKITGGGQTAYLINDDETLGEVKIIADDKSLNLLIFLESEIAKRGLKLDCGCHHHSSNASYNHEHNYAVDDPRRYAILDEAEGRYKIDTSADEYIINVLMNRVCPLYGLDAEIVIQ